MSDDHDASKVKERPVEPPIIDAEAEVSGEEKKPGPQTDAGNDAPKRQPSGGLLWRRRLLVPGAALVLAGLALWGLNAGGFRLTRDDGRMTALAQRIETLETTAGATGGEVAALASLAAEIKSALDRISSQAPQPPQGLDELKSRVDSIESGLESARTAIEAVGKSTSGGEADSGQLALLAARVDEIQQKLTELEKAGPAAAPAPQETNKGELEAAFAGLESPLKDGQPFTAELEKIAGISPALGGIEELRSHAATGAPSAADLAVRLQAIANRETAAPAAAAAVGEEGLWAGLRSKVSGLVKVRDLDNARWTDGMAAASRQLARGDVDGAVATLEAIEGPPPEGVKPWLAEAQARAALDRAAQTMAEAVRKETAGTP